MNTITSPTGTTVQPQRVGRKNRFAFWIGRILLGLLTLLLALAATGVIYQAVATALDRRTFAPRPLGGRGRAPDADLLHRPGQPDRDPRGRGRQPIRRLGLGAVGGRAAGPRVCL